MERRYGVREKGHKGDFKTLDEKKYTRSWRKDSLTVVHPTAIMGHIANRLGRCGVQPETQIGLSESPG